MELRHGEEGGARPTRPDETEKWMMGSETRALLWRRGATPLVFVCLFTHERRHRAQSRRSREGAVRPPRTRARPKGRKEGSAAPLFVERRTRLRPPSLANTRTQGRPRTLPFSLGSFIRMFVGPAPGRPLELQTPRRGWRGWLDGREASRSAQSAQRGQNPPLTLATQPAAHAAAAGRAGPVEGRGSRQGMGGGVRAAQWSACGPSAGWKRVSSAGLERKGFGFFVFFF